MRSFEQLLLDVDQNDREELIGRRFSDSKCFWISYSILMVGVGAVSMWAFFKYVVLA
jgi:hypothetical protein